MWFDEVERIGMQRCTPVGYFINGVGGIFWLLGILAFFGMPLYLAYRGFAGSFFWSLLWLLAVPVLLILVGSFLIVGSWTMAYRKKFYYDYGRRQSTWIVAGQKNTYSFSDYQATESGGSANP